MLWYKHKDYVKLHILLSYKCFYFDALVEYLHVLDMFTMLFIFAPLSNHRLLKFTMPKLHSIEVSMAPPSSLCFPTPSHCLQ